MAEHAINRTVGASVFSFLQQLGKNSNLRGGGDQAINNAHKPYRGNEKKHPLDSRAS